MKLYEPVLQELLSESKATRKMLEAVPEDKFSWKPHEKSMTLGHLASHLADIPNWVSATVETDELDFAASEYKPVNAGSKAELLKIFDDSMAKAVECLKKASDETLSGNWKMRSGDTVYFDLPKLIVLRNFVLSHSIHHRGQLSVYLRLNDIPLPSVYGPTADEAM
ncbi:MAG: DinB family protein [Ignavibacteria bacterium]|nr:DinB family protein [Ignavibacteria bacterium]